MQFDVQLIQMCGLCRIELDFLFSFGGEAYIQDYSPENTVHIFTYIAVMLLILLN